MSKYKWDYYEIRRNMIVLKTIYDNIEEEEIKPNIKTMIDFYNNMLRLANKNKDSFKDFDDSLKDAELNDLINEVAFSYNKKNLEILNILLQAFITVRENSIEDDFIDEKIAVTNDYLISITEDFFNKMTPPNIKREFDKAMEDKSFINFTYNKENSDYAGVTIYDAFLRKKYINVSRTNHLSDLIVLPHEMFHYIINDYDISIVNEYNTYYLTEVEGSLANILFGEYYYNESNLNDTFFIKYYMSTFQEGIESIAIRNQLLDSIKKNYNIRINKLNKFMGYYKMEPFEQKEEIAKCLEIPEEIYMKYSFSYLVALDLFYIYKRDPEYAFYLLKNIRHYKEEDDIISLLRRVDITFMDDNYSNFKKYTKEIKEKEKSK